MHRPIKFRVWSFKKKQWIHPPKSEVNLFGETILLGAFMNGVSIEDLNECQALQYTGLKDSHGNEIYEGDIIKELHLDGWIDCIRHEYIGVVRYITYSEDCMDNQFSGFVTYPNLEENKNFSGNEIRKDCEVIGNMFENPELLK